ncbi:hypothetical protein EON73_00955 [bacterium]|nr:MAG: hypothetical protein EON73_00955 [bacterium]
MNKLKAREKVEDQVLSKIILYSWLILISASFYQLIAYTDIANSVGVMCVAVAWGMITKIYLKANTFKNYPLSSLVIVGFSSTQFYFPLLFTSLEGKPITNNLDLPNQVFLHLIAELIILVLSNYLYRCVFNKSNNYKFSFLVKTGLFSPPTTLQLWLIGGMGTFASIYVYIISPSISSGVTGLAFDKFIQGFVPFSYAPFFIPFSKLFGDNRKPPKFITKLFCYTIILFLISMGRNSRGAFMLGFTSVIFSYGIGLIYGFFKFRVFTLKGFSIACVCIWLIISPLADLGTAMVNVRNERNNISPVELIVRTIEAYSDKEAIHDRRENDEVSDDDWDERYLSNIYTARFANLKYVDNSLIMAQTIGEKSSQILKFSIDYIFATLPQPLLNLFEIKIDKKMLKGSSFGDYMYYTSGAPSEVLEGYRTGNFAGTGIAAFGWWYLLILGIGIFPIYILFDMFFIAQDISNSSSKACFSLCGLLGLDFIFRFLPVESVVMTATFLLRDWIQMVILYLLIFHLSKLLSQFISALSKQIKY